LGPRRTDVTDANKNKSILRHDPLIPLGETGNEEAQVWGRLRVPYHENAIDKQIAATALTHDLILVTRNVDHFNGLGVRLFNPFD
jgi:predicted nucleic acid-binding protein